MAITLAELVYSELIGLVQRTRVSYPACFNKIRLTENMVDKRESYTKEDLLASGRGELFGAKGPQLPAPNMLMMDRVVKMTETVVTSTKGMLKQNWISIRICGSSDATLLAIRLCRDAWAWTQCGSW